VTCRKRRAAYVVIVGSGGAVAAIRAAVNRENGYWLPGGGVDSGETSEEAAEREVREELGRSVRLIGRIGEAVQFFYAADEDQWYEMTATFFGAEFDGTPLGTAEHDLCWLDANEQREVLFHACHAWAASQAWRFDRSKR
jgi:8-oxo-dGTP diphosphatase